MSDPFENFQQLFASHSESFGREEKFVLDTRDLDLPVHIKWNFLGIISYLLSHPMNEHTEMILGKLLEMGRKVNNEMGNVPALTALAFQASNSVSNQQFSLTIARITRKLLDNGADPLFVSRKTCRYTHFDIFIIFLQLLCVEIIKLDTYICRGYNTGRTDSN
jgi:hypothetical protein